jgi:hypothetical protein
MRAESDLDKYRMDALAASNALQFFKPVAANAATRTDKGAAGGK